MRKRRNRKDAEVVAEPPVWSKGIEPFLRLDPGAIWRHYKGETFAFKMLSIYFVFEYFRPQSIITSIDILPWSQMFIILSMVGLLGDKRSRLKTHPANYWMCIFFLSIFISIIFAYEPQVSWEYLIQFYGWFILYFLVVMIVSTKERFLIILFIIFAASLKLSLFGAKSWVMRGFSFTSWGLSGPPGYFQNSGELAIQMLIFLFISFQFIQIIRPWISNLKYKILLCLFPVTAGMTIMASSSRGGQIAMLIGLLFYYKEKISVKNILIVSFLCTLVYLMIPQEQKERFSEIGEDRSSQQRLLYWKYGIEMWKDHKITGVGYFNFIPYYEDHYSEHMISGYVELAHNIFIQILVDMGLQGFIPYIILIWYSLIRSNSVYGIKNSFRPGFNSAFIAYVVAGQFVSVAFYPFMWVHLSLVVAIENINKSLK